MGATALASPPSSQALLYSVKEYLKLERRTGERHEFVNGKIIKMAGGSIKHNLLTVNIIHELKNNLDELDNMYVFGSDQKVYLPEFNVYVYPDAVVICGTPIVSDKDSQAITNPLVIIEVLSPSTQEYDKIEKFNDYRTLPSFKEYVLISQDKAKVTTYFREENGTWAINDFRNIEDNVFLKSLNISVLMSRIYKRVL